MYFFLSITQNYAGQDFDRRVKNPLWKKIVLSRPLVFVSISTKCSKTCLSMSIFSCRELCIPVNTTNEMKLFLKTVNNRFESDSFSYGGKVKTADHVDFIAWLKDDYLLNGDNRRLRAAPLIGYIKDHRQWVLSEEVSVILSSISHYRFTSFILLLICVNKNIG